MIKRSKRSILAVAAVLVLSAILFTGGTVIGQEADADECAYAIVDGTKVSIVPGKVIATGELASDGTCELPRIVLVGEGTEDSSHGYIKVHVTENCEVVVTEVTFDQNATPPPEVSPGPGVGYPEPIVEPKDVERSISSGGVSLLGTQHYRGWAESENNDWLGIDVTRVHAAMSYYDNGSQVYGGHNPYNQCYWMSHFKCLDCDAHWIPSGPSNVYINTEGEFELKVTGWWWHWHKAQYNAYPGGYYYWCAHQGSVIPGGYWKCEGGRQTL